MDVEAKQQKDFFIPDPLRLLLYRWHGQDLFISTSVRESLDNANMFRVWFHPTTLNPRGGRKKTLECRGDRIQMSHDQTSIAANPTSPSYTS